jgi:NADH-quinone oxidoreductase subunit E
MSAHAHGTHTFDPHVREKLQFSEESLATIKNLMTRYPEGKHKSALLPVLHIAQAEFDGWLSAEVMDLVAEAMSLHSIEVFEVASFYSMYNLQPVGKCQLEVCRTSSCWTRGAEDIVDYISKKLNIREGETTPDGMFTLKTVECLGSCGTAPMLQCGAEYHENLTESKVDALIERYKAEGKRRNYTDLDYTNSK